MTKTNRTIAVERAARRPILLAARAASAAGDTALAERFFASVGISYTRISETVS